MSSFWQKPFRNILGSNTSQAITNNVIDPIIPQGLKDLIEPFGPVKMLYNALSKKKTSDPAVLGAAPDSAGVLDKMFASADATTEIDRKKTMEQIAEAMQGRGIRTSGIHMQALDEMGQGLEKTNLNTKYGAALDMFNALTGANNRSNYLALQEQQRRDAQSEKNQQGRNQIAGLLAQLLMAAV